MKSELFKGAGVLALIAGVILIASGVTSSSILLAGLGFADKYLGPKIPLVGSVLQLAVVMLTLIVGLGGILVVAGGVLLLRRHVTSARILIGLGGGTAIFGLLFSIAEALYVSGFSAPVFHQSFFTLYWTGAILATVSILLSRKG